MSWRGEIYSHSTEFDSIIPCSETSGDVVVASDDVGVRATGTSPDPPELDASLGGDVENRSPPFLGRSLKDTHFCTVINPAKDGSILGMRRVDRRCC